MTKKKAAKKAPKRATRAKKKPVKKREKSPPKSAKISDRELLAILARIPKKIWRQMSGRQDKVLNEQADRYGAPLRGAHLNVSAIAKWLHDFLAENKYRLKAASTTEDEDGALMAGGNSPALEDLRRQKAELAKLQLQRERGEVCAKDEMHQFLQRALLLFRDFGHQLQTMDADAFALFEDFHGDVGRLIDEFFGNAFDDDQTETNAG